MTGHPVGEPVPLWALRVTVTAVSVVVAVAAVVSYVHMHELAERAREGWRAWLDPLLVDGMLVAASMVMYVRRREGERAGLLPWTGLLLGLGASLGANVAAADPLWHPWWSALALAVSFELLILVNRGQRPAVGPLHVPVDVPVGSRDDQQEPDSEPADVPAGDEDDPVVKLVEAGLGRRRLAKELKIPESQARVILAGRKNGSGD